MKTKLAELPPVAATEPPLSDDQADRPPADRAVLQMVTSGSGPIGSDPGESIYNDRLKRFKFRLEKLAVTSAAEMAETFWIYYRHRGYPPLAGVWGDPRTNSLVIVGPPQADQPIRDTIAEMEGATIGIDLPGRDLLTAQYYEYQEWRAEGLEKVARGKLDLIDAEAREKPDPDNIAKLSRKLEAQTAELATIERKLKVIRESMDRLQGDESEKLDASNEHSEAPASPTRYAPGTNR